MCFWGIWFFLIFFGFKSFLLLQHDGAYRYLHSFSTDVTNHYQHDLKNNTKLVLPNSGVILLQNEPENFAHYFDCSNNFLGVFYVKIHQIVPWNYVQFIAYQFCLTGRKQKTKQNKKPLSLKELLINESINHRYGEIFVISTSDK